MRPFDWKTKSGLRSGASREIVAEDLVAIAERSAHRAVRLERANAEVDRRCGIPDFHFRRVFGGNAVARRELREAGERRRLLPLRLVQRGVHLQAGLVEAWRTDGELTLPAVEHLAARRRGGTRRDGRGTRRSRREQRGENERECRRHDAAKGCESRGAGGDLQPTAD